MGDPLSRVVAALQRHGCDPRPRGRDAYESRCPAHDGTRHNLSVALGDQGAVLLKCHHVDESGRSCRPEDIVGAIGLSMVDLFPGNAHDHKTNGKASPRSYPDWKDAARAVARRLGVERWTAAWEYYNADGRVVMVAVRFDPPGQRKEFRPISPCPGGWRIGEPGGLIPLFNLLKILGCVGDVIYITEGEKCACALGQYMPFTTTSAFGAGKASKTDWGSLAGKVVVILPDHDASGEGHIRSVLAELAKLDPRPRVKVVRLPDLAEGEDVADWLPRVVGDQQGNAALEAVRGLLRSLVQSSPWVDLNVVQPEDLQGEPAQPKPGDFTAAAVVVPEWPDPPEDVAFHGLAGCVVKAIMPHSEADAAGVLLQLLIGFGNALGSGLSVLADGHYHHANEYVVTVGNTSRARKGTAWRRVRAFLNHVDAEWADARIAQGLSSGEGLIFEIKDPEGEDDKHGVIDKRLLLVESEFGNVLRVLSREGNTLSGVLRMGWDGDTLRTLTKNSPMQATNPHVSLIGHITAEELTRYLSHVEVFNGLGNRILWACVRRSKRLPFGGVVPGSDLAAIGPRLASALTAARAVGVMDWTPAARTLWESEYDNLTVDRPGLWGAITSRAEAHVLRLSMIYAALDGVNQIADTHVIAALAVWRFSDRSARHLFGGSVGDKGADEILNALRVVPEGMTRTEIRDLFGRNKLGHEIARALELLLRYGLVRRESSDTGGRPSERWFANGAGRTTTT